jgi:hypothetical protein
VAGAVLIVLWLALVYTPVMAALAARLVAV